MRTKIYQLVCSGDRKSFSGTGPIYSKKVFTDHGDAEQYGEAFKELCCGEGLMDLDEGTAEVKVLELELNEGLSEDKKAKKDKALALYNEQHRPTPEDQDSQHIRLLKAIS